MGNVFKFPAPIPLEADSPALDWIDTDTVMSGIFKLWHAGIITTPAYFIGCQALYFLASNTNLKSQFISMSRAEIESRGVTYQGDVLAGRVLFTKDADFTDALSELHYFTGILNQTDLTFFNESKNPRSHFTVKHPSRADRPVLHDTKINFRLDRQSPEHYKAWVNDQVSGSLFGLLNLAITKKPAQ